MTTTPDTVKCKHCKCYVPIDQIVNGYCALKAACVSQWNPSGAAYMAESDARFEEYRREMRAISNGTNRPPATISFSKGFILVVLLIFFIVTFVSYIKSQSQWTCVRDDSELVHTNFCTDKHGNSEFR